MTVCYQVKREFKTGGPPRRMGFSIGGPPSASGGGSGWKPSDYLKHSGRKNVTMPLIWALAFIDSKILIGKAPGSADHVRRFKKTTFSVNAKQTLSPRRVPRCQCIRSVQPHAPPVVGVTPVRARGRSWDVYFFVAHPGIRQEKEIIATQPIEPKCIEYLRRSEATRKSEIPEG